MMLKRGSPGSIGQAENSESDSPTENRAPGMGGWHSSRFQVVGSSSLRGSRSSEPVAIPVGLEDHKRIPCFEVDDLPIESYFNGTPPR